MIGCVKFIKESVKIFDVKNNNHKKITSTCYISYNSFNFQNTENNLSPDYFIIIIIKSLFVATLATLLAKLFQVGIHYDATTITTKSDSTQRFL